jgi:uncharacterized membrane protein YozB (DUF420 family)
MNAPVQAVAGLVWAVMAPPLLIYAATRVRRGQLRLHGTLMGLWVVVELAVFAGFTVFLEPGPRQADLRALPIFKIHLAFAVATLLGIGWQLGSRAAPRLRPLHRHSGPYVIMVWCLALVTGIYNYVFVYLIGAP